MLEDIIAKAETVVPGITGQNMDWQPLLWVLACVIHLLDIRNTVFGLVQSTVHSPFRHIMPGLFGG